MITISNFFSNNTNKSLFIVFPVDIDKSREGDLRRIYQSNKSLSLVITILVSSSANIRISLSVVRSLLGKSSVWITSKPFLFSITARLYGRWASTINFITPKVYVWFWFQKGGKHKINRLVYLLFPVLDSLLSGLLLSYLLKAGLILKKRGNAYYVQLAYRDKLRD